MVNKTRLRSDETTPFESSRYELLTKIATGGMATVYVGRVRGAIGFSRLVAIKRPHPFVADDPVLRRTFEREARVASLIHHPHVVSILDVEEHGSEIALVLDYIDGGTLSDLWAHATDQDTPMPIRVALRIILDIASGLHAAHTLRGPNGEALGIVHRDVSPQNILVGIDGLARLTDFGIAKIADQNEHTATDTIKGKLSYLPPEYLEKRKFDARSDEYALAVVAWESLAGRRLFRSETEVETMRNIIHRGAIPLPAPNLLPLDAVLTRALARSPDDRFASVAEFADALERAARKHDWVGTAAEVAGFANEALGPRVLERRQAVASRAPIVEASEARRIAAGAHRDAMPTLTLEQKSDLPVKPPKTKRGLRGLIAIGLALALASIAGLAVWALPRHTREAPVVLAPSAIVTATATLAPDPTPNASIVAPTETHTPFRTRPNRLRLVPTVPLTGSPSVAASRAPPNPYNP